MRLILIAIAALIVWSAPAFAEPAGFSAGYEFTLTIDGPGVTPSGYALNLDNDEFTEPEQKSILAEDVPNAGRARGGWIGR